MKNISLQIICLSLLAVFTLPSCTPQDNLLIPEKEAGKISQIPPDTKITVESFEPLGHPYSLIIYANGEVVFTPKSYQGYGKPTFKEGVFKSRISPEKLEGIIREFEKQKFFFPPGQLQNGRGRLR